MIGVGQSKSYEKRLPFWWRWPCQSTLHCQLFQSVLLLPGKIYQFNRTSNLVMISVIRWKKKQLKISIIERCTTDFVQNPEQSFRCVRFHRIFFQFFKRDKKWGNWIWIFDVHRKFMMKKENCLKKKSSVAMEVCLKLNQINFVITLCNIFFILFIFSFLFFCLT